MSNNYKIPEKIIDFADIKPFIPGGFTEYMEDDIFDLMQNIQRAVLSQLPIGIIYKNTTRIILPHSLYLQSSVRRQDGELVVPENINTRMRLYKTSPRTAIGMDAYQIDSRGTELHESSENAPKISRNGWKSFHLDEVSHLELLTHEKIREVFELKNDSLGNNVHLTDGFATIHDFVQHWNYPFREFYAQAPARWDMQKSTE